MNELNDEARRLIDAAIDADGPSDARLDAIGGELLRKLGSGTAALSAVKLAAAASPGATTLKAGTSGLAAYFLIGATAGVGVTVTSAAVSRFSPNTAAVKQPAPQAAEPGRARRVTPEGTGATASGADGAQLAPLPVAAPPAAPPHEPQSEPEPPRGHASTLSVEVERLREIQAFLAAGNGARALAASDRYFAEQHTGTLRDEHLAARVLALCMVGDATRARAAARLFVATGTASPLQPRLAHSCVADVVGKRDE